MNTEYFSSINEVSKRLDVPAHTLRYWEKQFPAAVKPTTGAGGRRYYRTETVDALEIIKDLLYNRGMTIMGVKKMLKDGSFETRPAGRDSAPPRGGFGESASPISKKPQKSEIAQAIELLESAHSLLAA